MFIRTVIELPSFVRCTVNFATWNVFDDFSFGVRDHTFDGRREIHISVYTRQTWTETIKRHFQIPEDQ